MSLSSLYQNVMVQPFGSKLQWLSTLFSNQILVLVVVVFFVVFFFCALVTKRVSSLNLVYLTEKEKKSLWHKDDKLDLSSKRDVAKCFN